MSNKPLAPSQSAFLPRESCIAELLSIIHKLQVAFDKNSTVDVRDDFFNISKAFDKTWHDGLTFKLKSFGVEEALLSLLKNYLENCEVIIVLNGQTSGREKLILAIHKDWY